MARGVGVAVGLGARGIRAAPRCITTATSEQQEHDGTNRTRVDGCTTQDRTTLIRQSESILDTKTDDLRGTLPEENQRTLQLELNEDTRPKSSGCARVK